MDRHVSLTVTLFVLIIFSLDIGFTAGCRKGKSFHYSNPEIGVSKITSNPYRIVKSSPLVSHIKTSTSSVLLSVDLGLRSGFAFYNSTGSLLSFEYHRFDTLPKLETSVLAQLDIATKVHDISHFALEGDNVYRSIWTSAINQYAAVRKKETEIINVKPSEWRARILTNSERKSGKDAKCAARQICRQIMYRSGLDEELFIGPMNTDTSEAILLGFYVVHDKLMWAHTDPRPLEQSFSISDEECSPVRTDVDINSQVRRDNYLKFAAPLIHRYTNGNVILPPKQKNQSTG